MYFDNLVVEMNSIHNTRLLKIIKFEKEQMFLEKTGWYKKIIFYIFNLFLWWEIVSSRHVIIILQFWGCILYTYTILHS